MVKNTRDLIAKAYERLLENFIHWAQDQDEIRSAVVIGSRARTDHPADEFSDLDLSIFVKNPQAYLSRTEWLEEIGVPWLSFIEPTGDRRHWERRCLFEGGLDVDFAFVPDSLVIEMIEDGLPPESQAVFQRGYKILIDKDRLLAQVNFENANQVSKPQVDEKAFLNAVNDFWYHAVWTAKHLRRGELWWAKDCCDGHMKGLLRQMLEWQAQSLSGQEKDTWMRGRFLEEWVDPRAAQALKTAFGSYEIEDVWRALKETMELFEWVSIETKEACKFSYPKAGVSHSKSFVEQLFRQRH